MELARPDFVRLPAPAPPRDPLSIQIGIATSPELLNDSLSHLALTLTSFPTASPYAVHVADLGHTLDSAIAAIEKVVLDNPIAAATAVDVLRTNASLSIEDGLIIESLAYSTLQGGPEFAAWLASRPRRTLGLEPDPIRLHREGDTLEVVLDRPAKHNALNRAMRDSLLDALEIATTCPEVTLALSGNGPSFCSGGDLDEFGQFADPATAHVVRTALSLGARLAPLAERSIAHLHGFAGGSGLELAAFCGRVVAADDTRCFLPEIGLGLIPGAGGTVSINRRIGRWRTAALLLTAAPIDAVTALSWGLVDALA